MPSPPQQTVLLFKRLGSRRSSPSGGGIPNLRPMPYIAPDRMLSASSSRLATLSPVSWGRGGEIIGNFLKPASVAHADKRRAIWKNKEAVYSTSSATGLRRNWPVLRSTMGAHSFGWRRLLLVAGEARYFCVSLLALLRLRKQAASFCGVCFTAPADAGCSILLRRLLYCACGSRLQNFCYPASFAARPHRGKLVGLPLPAARCVRPHGAPVR